MSEDITICNAAINHVQKSRIYYYQGNVYQPIGGYKNRKVKEQVERKIKAWMRQNKEMILKDRAHPEYKTLVQLADLHFEEADKG